MDTLKIGLSGIRGKVGSSLTPEIISNMATAVGTWCGAGANVALAVDHRKSSAMLKSVVVGALMGAGNKVIDVGRCTTCAFQFFMKESGIKAGIMITGGNGPGEYNGMLVINDKGMKLLANDMETVLDIYHARYFEKATWDKLGFVNETGNKHVLKYIEALKTLANVPALLTAGLKVAIDTDNDNLIAVLGIALKEIGVSAIFSKGEGDKAVKSAVKKGKADLGFVLASEFTVGHIIGKKKTFEAELVYPLVLSFLLKEKKGVVVTGASSTLAVEEIAKKNKCTVVRSRAGMDFTAEAVDNEAGIVAGESCGSVMFPELNYGYDSAAVIVYLLSKVAENNITIDAAGAALPKYTMIKKAINASPAAIYSAMNGLRTDMAKKKIKMDESDGVKISEKSGFLIIRPATLDNSIRIAAEATTAAKAKSLLSLGEKLIKKYI